MTYPDDWICKLCKRVYSLHIKLGQNSEELQGATNDGVFVLATQEWCYSLAAIKADSEMIISSSTFFTPVDNLTQVELRAKQLNLI